MRTRRGKGQETAEHDTIGGITHHHRTRGRIDEGMVQKIELTNGSTAVSSAILESPEDDGRNMWYAYTSDAEEILTFRTSKGFKK
jgi:hypothetical protein